MNSANYCNVQSTKSWLTILNGETMRKKRLVIVRHGNTFKKGETPTRVGARTDLPLVERERSEKAAEFLKTNNAVPERIFAAPLKRTMETAGIIKETLHVSSEIEPASEFTEIDYGPDENCTEEAVANRLGRYYLELEGAPSTDGAAMAARGELALKAWNDEAIVPFGWRVDVQAIIDSWKRFAESIPEGGTYMIVSSNGIIRFAPHIARIGFEEFRKQRPLKVATGGVCVFDRDDSGWECVAWNGEPFA